jgi:hypothetical protein
MEKRRRKEKKSWSKPHSIDFKAKVIEHFLEAKQKNPTISHEVQIMPSSRQACICQMDKKNCTENMKEMDRQNNAGIETEFNVSKGWFQLFLKRFNQTTVPVHLMMTKVLMKLLLRRKQI